MDGTSAWSQQKALLVEEGRREHPRKAFMQDLEVFIKRYQSKGHDIIVGGDFNETTEESNSGLLGLAVATGLAEPWIIKHPNQEKFRTCQTGKNQNRHYVSK